MCARHPPFSNEGEYKILLNDWPYGIDEKIVHLVVWTKFALEDDLETGDTREDAKRDIQMWVDRVFGEECGGENVSYCFYFLFIFIFIFDVYSISVCT